MTATAEQPNPILSSAIRSALAWTLIAAATWFLFGASLTTRVIRMSDPLVFADDARIWLPPYYAGTTPGSLDADYVSTYLKSITPIAYRQLFDLLSQRVDPGKAGKVLSLLLLIPLLAGLAVAGHVFAGRIGAFFVMALALSSPLYIERMSGGLPRGFGYPMLALATAALVTGRIPLLCAITVVGAGLYPPAALVAGASLALVLLALPARDRGDAVRWTLTRRLLTLSGTAALCGALIWPSMQVSKAYGRSLGPADLVAYPEIGPLGRYEPPSRVPYPNVIATVVSQSLAATRGAGEPLLPSASGDPLLGARRSTLSGSIQALVLAAALLGCLVLALTSPAMRRLATLGLASVALYLAAVFLAPRLFAPTRYVTYPVPLLAMVMLVAGGAMFGRLVANARRRGATRAHESAGAASLAAMCLLLFGGHGNPMAGLIDERPLSPVFDFVRTLPPTALIAGWPVRVLDDIPYATGRRVLMNYETHQVFHQGYADEMRRRVFALMNAYFASEREPLVRLREDFGVTHVVVNRSHFLRTATYFEPFNAALVRLQEQGRARGFQVLRELDRAGVFTAGDYSVLDLARLP